LTGFFFAGAWTASGFLILEAACFSHSVDIVFPPCWRWPPRPAVVPIGEARRRPSGGP